MILLLITTIFGFRLLTLDQVYEKQKDMFIMNSESNLKIQKVDTLNITNFYVVLHSRKIFFYTKGSYYGFIYDNDNVKLKLGPASINTVQYFTQNTGLADPEENASLRKIKVLKWDDLIKKRDTEIKEDTIGTDNSTNIKSDIIKSGELKTDIMRDDIMSTRKGLIEKKHTDKLSLHQRMPASNIGLGSMKGLEDSIAYEETEYPTVLSNKAMSKNQHRTDEEECDGSKSMCHKPKNLLHYKSEMKVEANPLRRPGIAGKRMDEIESDSNVLDSKFLDIKVNTIDRNKQTFVLKNDGNLCVTYFEKSFILAECRQSKRQVFKLVEVEEVMNRLNPKGRPMEEDTIEGEKEESSSEENEENKFDRENSKSKFKRENSKPDKKDKKKKRPSKSEEDLTESVEYAEKIERVFPENLREVHLKDINSLYNPQNQMKANMEHQCRDLLNRNLGRLDVLPEECKRLLETPANPMMARTTLPRGGISGFSMVKTNYVPARKRSQNDVQKEKASIYEVNRTNNILTRLEKALRT